MNLAEREEKLKRYYELAKNQGETEKAKKALLEIKNLREISPTKGMSGLDKVRAGFGKAITDTGRGIGNLLGVVSDEDITEAQQRDKYLMDDGYGMAGNIAGHAAQFALPGGVIAGAGKAANSAKLLNLGKALAVPKTIPAAAAGGALYGAIQPGDRSENALLGGTGGAVGQGILSLVGNTIAPTVSQSVRGLLDLDVPLTPGMILGGASKKAEDALTSVPIVGSAIAKTQNKAVEGFNKATWNKVLEPIGKSLPDGIKAGREAFVYVDDTISAGYNKLLPKMKAKLDGEISADLSKINQMVMTLTNEQIDQYNRIMDRSFYKHFTDAGLATGESLKRVESEIGKHAAKMRNNPDPKISEVGDALTESLMSLRRMLERQNPEFAPDLKALNKSYAMMLRPERASIYRGAQDGKFTASQLDSAVSALEKNKRKIARGEGLLQDFSESARGIMGDTLNESGTAPRLMHALAAGGGALYDPFITGSTLVGSSAYGASPVQSALRGLLSSRPDSFMPIGGLLKNNAYIGGTLGTGVGLLP